MKSIPYLFYVSDLELEPRVVDGRSDRSVPLGNILKTTVGQATDPSLAAVNAAIDRYNAESPQSRSKLVPADNYYLSQFSTDMNNG